MRREKKSIELMTQLSTNTQLRYGTGCKTNNSWRFACIMHERLAVKTSQGSCSKNVKGPRRTKIHECDVAREVSFENFSESNGTCCSQLRNLRVDDIL